MTGAEREPPQASSPVGRPPATAVIGDHQPAVTVAKPGARQTGLDMVRSLGLIAVIVAISLVFTGYLLHPGKKDLYPAQGYSDYVSGFRQLTGTPALAPSPLPSGWKSNGGSLSRAPATHLHIGFVTPGSHYAGLEETDGPGAAFVTQVLGRRGATSAGSAVIDGVTWQRRVASDGDRSLLRTVGKVTVIVTGSATPEQLVALAASLH